MIFVILCQPERLRDEEIDDLEQQLRSQALGAAPQPTTQEESPLPGNCFKFQNRVFGESRRTISTFESCVVCPSQTSQCRLKKDLCQIKRRFVLHFEVHGAFY